MASTKRFDGYLNDHLAGAAAAIELAEQSRRQNEGRSLSTYLITLIPEIEEDRNSLVAVMERLGVERNVVKEAAGWVAEKASRLKFQAPVGVDDEVNRLLEVEALLAGISAKQRLWEMLGKASASEVRLAGFDFDALQARAVNQIETLNGYRVETFAGAFGS